jgi:hypothetical protein
MDRYYIHFMHFVHKAKGENVNFKYMEFSNMFAILNTSLIYIFIIDITQLLTEVINEYRQCRVSLMNSVVEKTTNIDTALKHTVYNYCMHMCTPY